MKALIASFACALAFAAATAPAALAEAPSKSIRLADYDLSRPADVARLAHRIKRASAEVCTQAKPDSFASAYERDRLCRIAAVDKALAAIGNPQLAALFQDAPGQFAAR